MDTKLYWQTEVKIVPPEKMLELSMPFETWNYSEIKFGANGDFNSYIGSKT
jgi:hypothetical protein